jgi:predicted porin
MQKKLLAVAVAGALGAPAFALAQTSTVQVFGTLYVEYAYIDQGSSPAAGFPELSNVDFLQTPGSEIGFKGEEKLGGGLSAWFQCASTADVRGQNQDGWCSRNSAIGLKGGFGNVFIGVWDTPFKRTVSPTNVGGNDTGVWGTAFLLLGNSTTTAVGGTREAFKRRQQNSINYDSPNFGGFQVMAAFTSAQTATGTLAAASNNKPRVGSLGVQYSAGPLYVSAGYETHMEFNGAGRDGDDKAWHVGAAYTWGPVRFGGQYVRQKFEMGTTAAPTEVRFNGYHVGVDWRIVGPHGLRAGYTRASDSKGTPGAASPGGIRPGVALAGASNDNGAKLYQVRYVYTFSKRTEFTAGWVMLDNDSAGTYRLGGLQAAVRPGEEQDGLAFGIRHTF